MAHPDTISDYPERLANIASITEIPSEAFPDVAARAALVARALEGQDVYAYTSPAGEWIIWIGPDDPTVDGRLSPEEWTARFYGQYEHETLCPDCDMPLNRFPEGWWCAGCAQYRRPTEGGAA